MFRLLRCAAAWFFAAVLVACGGGGGDGAGAGAPPTASPALRFEPAALVMETDPGVSAPIMVTATPNLASSGTVYLLVVDTRGVINPTLALSAQPDGSFVATLSTVAALPAGRHTGQIEVRICPVADCAQQFPGSPVMLPYDITVGTASNLTPVSRLAGVADWEMHQGNAAHTGHVSVTLDATRFSTRWRWISPDAGIKATPPVVANDMAYVVTSGYFAPVSRLTAVREFDGVPQWSHSFGSVFAANAPSVSASAVYVATSGHADTAMWSFSANDGAVRFRTPFDAQWEHYYAPTVWEGTVYSNGGSYGGLLSFNALTGASGWFTQLMQYDEWTPAVDATQAYANVGGRLSVIRRSDGAITSEYSLGNYAFGSYDSRTVPVLVGNGRVLVRSSGGVVSGASVQSLSLIDTTLATTTWSVVEQFAVDPVVANGTVYIANASPLQIEARSLSTGQVLWTRPLADPADTGFAANLVITDSHLFFSTNRRTYALDIGSRTLAWTYNKPGHKAISANGVLYLSTLNAYGESDGGVTAVNLR